MATRCPTWNDIQCDHVSQHCAYLTHCDVYCDIFQGRKGVPQAAKPTGPHKPKPLRQATLSSTISSSNSSSSTATTGASGGVNAAAHAISGHAPSQLHSMHQSLQQQQGSHNPSSQHVQSGGVTPRSGTSGSSSSNTGAAADVEAWQERAALLQVRV